MVTTPIERYAFLMSINPGTEEEYERRHRELWPEMHAALVRSGYRNYTLFRSGLTVAGYCECAPDIETVMTAMSAEPITADWDASLAHVIARRADGSGFATPLTELWHID